MITHGTDTMAETVAAVAQPDLKKIVLTGIMISYSFGNSDAPFNLGAAMTATHLPDPKVYIAMHGKLFA